MTGYYTNIEDETLNNTHYRKVLFTGPHMQLVVMTLQVGEDIPEEIHETHDQFFRVEEGQALIRVGETEYLVNEDEVVIVPGGQAHYVKNNSAEKALKLYTIYAPAEHPDGTVHETKAQADSAEHHD
jgi:mannose-6-phosphate isomerase-like protein (cupin superfamily)